MALLLALATVLLVTAAGGSAAGPVKSGGSRHPAHSVCPNSPARGAACRLEVVTDAAGVPLAGDSPFASSLTPADFHRAYGLPTNAPAPFTLAIVDAYDHTAIESDLAVFDSQFGLPACTTANGCFRKVDQRGGTNYPAVDAGWAMEIALDVEVAHAICQNCKILLVEADSAQFDDLGAAENEAVSLGADAISNSWGAPEFRSETSLESAYFDHPGVAITAATGDNGYGTLFPAASRYVTAVGGTTLTLGAGGTYGGETAWSGTGSGCARYVAKPSWQHDSGCRNRSMADVAAVADPNTGAAIYDSIPYGGQSKWMQVGGTSLATPIVAATYLLAGTPGRVDDPSALYGHAGSLHDVTSGRNGFCGSYLCTAGPGYDGPTGLGTPNGVAAFAAGGGVQPAPDFSLSALPGSQTVTQGASSSFTVDVSGSGGFGGSVSLSASGLPAGASGTFTPTSIGSGDNSTLSIATTAATPIGSYQVTVTGRSGALSHSTTVTLGVVAATVPDFSLNAVPSTRSVTAGGTAAYTISVSGIGGFTGSVSLSQSGLPSGTAGNFSPATVNVGSSSSLQVSTPAGLAAGNYLFTVRGSGSPGTHTISLSLVVTSAGGGGGGGQTADFSLSVSPSSVNLPSFGTATVTVTVQRLGGFTAPVSLTVSGLQRGFGASFSPNPTTTTSTLTLTLRRRLSYGSFSLTITGRSGSLTHTASLTIIPS